MLTDDPINIAQKLLKNSFKEIAGLQDTVIGKTKAFGIVKNEKKYVQILHSGSFHWICVANMQSNKTDNGYCQIHDILTSESFYLDPANQIATF